MSLLVSVDLPGVLGQEVAGWADGEAGWQVVDGAGPPAPALTLSARALADRACVVVVDGLPDPEGVRAALLGGALDVVAWPHERERLRGVAARLPGRAAAGSPLCLPVAGRAGGAGASTLAVTLGALLAWGGQETLLVGDEDLLALCGMGGWGGPGAADLAALEPADAAAEVAGLAKTVPGVPRLAVLAGTRHG